MLGAGVRRQELRRAEEPAVLHAVERRVWQEVQVTRSSEVDAVVLEGLALEIAEVDRDRLGTELDEQPREPGLEERGAPAGLRGAAAVGSRGEIEDPLAAHRLERSVRTA